MEGSNRLLADYHKWLHVNYPDSPQTRRSYFSGADLYLRWNVEPLGLQSARRWLEQMILDKVKGATIQQRKYALLAFYRFLEDEGHVRGVTGKLLKLKTPKSLRHNPVYLPEEHYAKVLELATDIIDRAQLMLTWDCALRVQELMGLTVDDLRDKPGYLRVQVAKRQEGFEYAYTPIEDTTVKAVKEYMSHYRIRTGMLFPAPMTAARPRGMLFRLCKRAGVAPAGKKAYNIHAIRHGRAMERYRYSGYNLDFVNKWLRHQSMETTKIYAHMEPYDVKAISDEIAKKKARQRGVRLDE